MSPARRGAFVGVLLMLGLMWLSSALGEWIAGPTS